jgi:hypothetical protein
MLIQNIVEPGGNPIIQIWMMKDFGDVAHHMEVLLSNRRATSWLLMIATPFCS